MKKFTCTILISLTAIQWLSGADAPAPVPAIAEAAQEAAGQAPPRAEVPMIELKNKSSFTMEESGRNPFWPIGWKPAAKISNSNERAGPEVLATSFLVSSILLDPGAKFAIVNGKTMQEGQVFGLQMGNQTYQITVKSIEDGQVILMRRDQEITVPLRRK